MGAPGKTPPTSSSMQRVKVYRLSEDGKWDDQGTGHVTVDYLERSDELGLIVIDEEDNETLLVNRISSNEIYRRQEDTIISWRDPNISTDLAISFQEPVGCSYIWDQIIGVQRDLQFSTLGKIDTHFALDVLEASGVSHSNDERFHGPSVEPMKLPPVELSTLPVILKTVLDSGVANQVQVVELILQDKDFFPRLLDLFRINEGMVNMDNLCMISKLIKTIILLNSSQILDKVFGDEFIMDIIGALEYEASLSKVQPHRAFLKEHVVFKEAIPIKEPTVLSRIHQTYRINYIKDVILAGVLDEGTISSLNSIINTNNATVVSSLKDDTSFIHELFTKMKSSKTPTESKKTLVFFLQEFCSLSKSLPLVQQLHLYRDLASEGMLDIITETLQSHDKKLISSGTDILILFLNQDPNLLRTYVTQKAGLPLLGLLINGIITDFGEDTHCQFLEIIRILLDSYVSSNISQRDAIVEIFYENHLDQLIDVITSVCTSKNTEASSKLPLSGGKSGCRAIKPEILSNICELLCFCVLHHPHMIKRHFLRNNVIEKILYLTHRREKYLVVSAVRFMRTIISCKDEHLFRHVVKNNLLKPIVEAFVANGNHYNMLHSGVLDILEFIRKGNIKILIKYVVDSFWDQFSKYENLETVHGLKIKYDQSLEGYDTKDNTGAIATEPRKQSGERGLEKEEEDYFNEDSDEEDSASVASTCKPKRGSQPKLSNGVGSNLSPLSTGSGGLVDYDDDDDDDYNPPPRKIETCIEEEIIVKPMLKRKLVSIKGTDVEDSVLKKKVKTSSCRNDNTLVVASVCSTTSSLAGSNERSLLLPDTKIPEDGPDGCSNGLPPIGEESSPLKPLSNPSSEMSTKNNITSSGPYPVR